MKIIDCRKKTHPELLFLKARKYVDPAIEKVVSRVIQNVKEHGDTAIAQYVRKFDGVSLQPSEFRVREDEIKEAIRFVPKAERKILQDIHERIASFAWKGMKRNWHISTHGNGYIGEIYVPLDRVGVYVPGGTAPLVSTVLMTVTLASIAGVKEIVACTPCGRQNKKINPYLLYAMHICGVSEIFRIGGAQAIAGMAFGTKTIRKVQKIVGPGGPYVTAAKRMVYGEVGIDLVAGPSEIAIIADDSAQPEYVAADLLSQAEHGSGAEKCLLLTDSMELAKAVRVKIKKLVPVLNRQMEIKKVIREGMYCVVTPDLDKAVELCNQFAPEHLEIITKNPKKLLRNVKYAGAVFIGQWTPESVGDYYAGPSHVLPTGGTAIMFSGLTPDDFRRHYSLIAFSRADLLSALHAIELMGEIEGLDAHVLSAQIRFHKQYPV